MFHPRSIKLPATPLARFRLLFLVLALVGAVSVALMAAFNAHSLAEKFTGVLLSLGLAAYWIRGYKRGSFAVALEPLEAGAIFLILHVTPGDPLIPVLGICFRSLYGGPLMGLIRYLMYAAALFCGHAGRGDVQFDGDVARAMGLALAPILGQSLSVALRASETIQRRLTSIVQNSTDVVTIVGADFRIRWQAASIRGVLAQDPEALVGNMVHELIHPDDRAALDGYFAESQGRPDHARNLTLRLAHGDGGFRYFDVVAANRLHDTAVDGYVLNMRDATDRRELESELRSLAAQREHDAMHDPLTGLANRRRLFTRLEETTAEARAAKSKLALLLIDLDHFKELNDTLGHQAGDRLLREIGPRLEASVPRPTSSPASAATSSPC